MLKKDFDKMKQIVIELFDTADADSNGVIDRTEFYSAFSIAPESMFEMLDKNQDGKLDRQETLQFLLKMLQDESQ